MFAKRLSVPYTVSPTRPQLGSHLLHLLCRVCWLLCRENIFWWCTRYCVVTVIGKDLDSLSSRWTFNEALFMLQSRRERESREMPNWPQQESCMGLKQLWSGRPAQRIDNPPLLSLMSASKPKQKRNPKLRLDLVFQHPRSIENITETPLTRFCCSLNVSLFYFPQKFVSHNLYFLFQLKVSPGRSAHRHVAW